MNRNAVFWEGYKLGYEAGRTSLNGHAGLLLDQYIITCCKFVPRERIQASVLFNHFLRWRETCGCKGPITATWFGRAFSKRFPKIKSEGRVFYVGIALKPTDDEERQS